MIRNFINKTKNSMSLRTQLAVLIIASFTAIILPVVVYTYYSNTRTIVRQQVSVLTKLLNLEILNMDSYMSEIDRFSLLLRHDAGFMNIINSREPLEYADQIYIQTLLRSTFDSRNDLKSFRLFLINSGLNYEIESRQHKVRPFDFEDAAFLPGYPFFTAGRYYRYIEPLEEEGEFIRFFRTIIRIEDQQPLAIVELTLDTSYVDTLTRDHRGEDEILFIVDSDDRILYKTVELDDRVLLSGFGDMMSIADHGLSMRLQGRSYIATFISSQKHSYTIYNLVPRSVLDRQLIETRNISLVIGFAAILLTLGLSSLYLRLLTNPLLELSGHLGKVGGGNFSEIETIGGSREIIRLSESFNSMTRQIDELIRKTYISTINEKTAQLKALEAQLNPHLLYNTLQAISSEAIINKQMKINFMITALAAMLRYSIKGGEYVTLESEIKHVRDYLLLQDARFDDELSYDIQVATEAEKFKIPKISILTLVENSITHGMTGDCDRVHITVTCTLEKRVLIIRVVDNGSGINREKLDCLNDKFRGILVSDDESSSLGLINLNSRLKILYEGKAALEIISGRETAVTLTIPLDEEHLDV